ncbi:MAG: pentapeptide repeat-containing protein, partial [archaeon]
ALRDEFEISIDDKEVKNINSLSNLVEMIEKRLYGEVLSVKGYKAFEPGWICKGFQYEFHKVHEHKGPLVLCQHGFHFCRKPAEVFDYYPFTPSTKIAEVEALGDIIEGDHCSSKCVTNKIKLIIEVPFEEVMKIVNLGYNNDGIKNIGNGNNGKANIGDFNKGNFNVGRKNEGDYNIGGYNEGGFNTGSDNKGHHNTGNYNIGLSNSGSNNSGNHNTGHSNIGNKNTGCNNDGGLNTGCNNKGNLNTGFGNIGNRNTGDFNLTSHSTGVFCTQEPKIKFFDEESNMTLKEWRSSKAYQLLLRVNLVKEKICSVPEELPKEKAFRTWWKKLTEDEKETIKNIPNFNSEKFEKITGIKV